MRAIGVEVRRANSAGADKGDPSRTIFRHGREIGQFGRRRLGGGSSRQRIVAHRRRVGGFAHEISADIERSIAKRVRRGHAEDAMTADLSLVEICQDAVIVSMVLPSVAAVEVHRQGLVPRYEAMRGVASLTGAIRNE